MRTKIKQLFIAALASLARRIIRNYHPTVLMVTGSVGKTSTKDAVAAALSARYDLRKSEKGFNSEFGVPLTIIGAKNPWSSPIAWLGVFGQALGMLIFTKPFPKLLVLEVGADAPGDLAKILKIAKPDAVVVTALPAVPVHVEAYADPAAVREEEFAPATALPAEAPLIYSADDEYAGEYSARVNTKKMTFGYAEGADVRISDVAVWTEDGKAIGMQSQLTVLGTTYPLHVRGAFGRTQLYAPAAAMAAAVSMGMMPKEAFAGLESYVPPSGRGRLFVGIKDTILIDDTYNSSPAATEEALNSLKLISPVRRRVAILGDMLELGRYSEAEHRKIGHIAASEVQVIVSIGQKARGVVDAAREDGFVEDALYSFDTSENALEGIPDILQEGDVVLVKGSQSIRTERITKRLLADKADAKHLVRQEKEWQKR